MTDYQTVNNLKLCLSNTYYWSYHWSSGHGHATRWMQNIPDIKNDVIGVRDWCVITIKKITDSEVRAIFAEHFEVIFTRSDLLKAFESHAIVYDYVFFEKCFNLKPLYDSYVSTNLEIVPYFRSKGLVMSMEQLLKPIRVVTGIRRNREEQKCNNFLQRLLLRYRSSYISKLTLEIDKILQKDDTVSKKMIVSKSFLLNFNFSILGDRTVYKTFINHVFDEPVKLLTILKLLKRDIPYDSLTTLITISNFSDEERLNMIEHIYVEPYKDGDEQIIIDNMDVLSKNPSDIPEIIKWLCTGDSKTVLKPIQTLHKKLKFDFNQNHLTTVCEKPKKNYTLIKYILENSERDNVVVTRNVFDQVLSTGRVPRQVAMIAKFIKLEGD